MRQDYKSLCQVVWIFFRYPPTARLCEIGAQSEKKTLALFKDYPFTSLIII